MSTFVNAVPVISAVLLQCQVAHSWHGTGLPTLYSKSQRLNPRVSEWTSVVVSHSCPLSLRGLCLIVATVPFWLPVCPEGVVGQWFELGGRFIFYIYRTFVQFTHKGTEIDQPPHPSPHCVTATDPLELKQRGGPGGLQNKD